MVEGEVSACFAWAVGGDGIIECVKGFDNMRETVVDNGVKVGIEGLEDGDGAAVSTVFLWDKGSTCAFDGSWEDSCCKDDGDELFKELRPFWVKTGEYVQCEAFVA
jgi:hypothetical protein